MQLALLLLLVLALLAGVAAAAPRIGVATMQPGEIFWERFGHNALVVLDPATGEAISYNYGFFDPTEPDFVGRFVRGEPRYRLAALPFEQDMAIYRDEGRGVDIQWLALDATTAQALADALAFNARPENAHYRYDYFLDNCSTRVRDAIDNALGGALRRQMAGRSQGSTYRSEATRLASPAPLMWLGFDLGLGPSADVPLSRWAEAFVPMRLADALRDTRLPDGRPLVLEEQQILPHRLAPEPMGAPTRWLLWALAGVTVAIALAALGRRSPRAVAGFAAVFWLACGVAGALMLFIWLGTEHRFGWANRNLLLANPLCWLLLPGAVTLLRGRVPRAWFRVTLWAVAALPVAALFGYWLSVLPQRHLHWIALLWPLHLALAWTFGRRSARPGL
ncbi:membrane protein [Lysobacter arseniciresistens ZS79]|uniref:Membrane protein n=1 Tax=Lysobacter arseniciresistens ZS79 TaxID=913325 RepID=A0A0A0F166_9GAMM|nr:membrane protein [Lysobacter arseniciresistens ZS79]